MAEITDEIKLNRVKQASEAFKELKAIHAETSLTSLYPPEAGERDDADPSLPTWPVFRDAFIQDWAANRVIMTDKEADELFDKEVEESLKAIEASEADEDTIPTPVVTLTPVKTPIEPGSKRAEALKGPKKKPVVYPGARSWLRAPKKAAKKEVSVSARAEKLVAKLQRKASRTRREILIAIQDQLDVGSAYAATLYQKFAK